MNRILSFLLLGLLLYNMLGYPVAYLLESDVWDRREGMENVEKNLYSGDIVIKVPMSLPYHNDWEAPEPTSGTLRHDGDYYQVRTRQLINDTLYVHAEYDQNARDRYMTLVSHIQDDIATPHKKSASHLLKNFLKEFLAQGRAHLFFIIEYPERRLPAADRYCKRVPDAWPYTPAPPPDFA